ncbi:hypothetical protein [Thermococcus sp.]
MVIHIRRDGRVFSDDNSPNRVFFAGRKGDLVHLASVVGVIDLSVRDVEKPVYFIGGMEKLREPLEEWSEDDIVDTLIRMDIEVISIETRTLKKKLEAVVYGWTKFILPEELVKEIKKETEEGKEIIGAIRDYIISSLWRAMIYAEFMEPPVDELYTLDEDDFLLPSPEENVPENVFESLEYWWNLYTEGEGKP